jgi:hypothetical protein
MNDKAKGPPSADETITELRAENERLRASLIRERNARDAAVDAEAVALKAHLLDRLRAAREEIQLGRAGANHRAVELEAAVAEIDDTRKQNRRRNRRGG